MVSRGHICSASPPESSLPADGEPLYRAMGILFPNLGIPSGKAHDQTLSVASVTVAHAAAIGLIATVVPADRLADIARPFTARLIELAPEVPAPPPPPPKQPPKPQVQRVAQPVMVAAASTPTPEAPSFVVAPQPPAPIAAPPITVAPPVVAHDPVVVAARFDADYLDNPKPAYPKVSRKLGEEGKVVLRVRVSAAGLPEHIELKHTSGSARLDQAALDTVMRWRFVPARRGNEAIASWVLVPVTFNLQG